MYNITRGQLITCWIFGTIAFFIFGGLAENSDETINYLLGILIPFLLVFYTLGWRNNKK